MATRNSARHRVLGSPLAGVLRQAAQQTRSTTRRSVAVAGPSGDAGADGATGKAGTVGPQGPVGATGVAGRGVAAFGQTKANASGVATFTFDPPLGVAPYVTATPVAAATVVIATVSSVSTARVLIKLWKWDTATGTFVAATGIVHVAAYV